MRDKAELQRRRRILWQYIGAHVRLKRDAETTRDFVKGRPGVLVNVNRTRCQVDFVTFDQYGAPALENGEPVKQTWNIPIDMVLLPGSVEPDPRQKELF